MKRQITGNKVIGFEDFMLFISVHMINIVK
jgi:hypothetical protein